ncbi:hypothetical protein ALC60_02571 [Trachymyrmex zeteki]|uniref:Uncharacterized protein n=1 Tax=Mycetomoellerius zeteki TaxID=64791 RepID=A0A151XDJ5_9HYME|nr:hypothetical protein ALC60_02571 [Trachymyrmex zeteki]
MFSTDCLFVRCNARSILKRVFALTPTAYKFLEIGIVMGPMSHVGIAIGDTRGNRIVLPRATWTAFVEKKVDIERLVQSTTPSSLVIQDCVIELVKIHVVNTVKLSLCNKYLYMKPSTMLFMFELEQCVEHVYSDLCQCTNSVSDKFKYFITYLRQNCIMNKCDTINNLRKIYDKNSHIELSPESLVPGHSVVLPNSLSYGRHVLCPPRTKDDLPILPSNLLSRRASRSTFG